MKKVFAILLLVCLLTGCQLASEEKNETALNDKLVGVFVTFDSLNLSFDLEGYVRDNGMPNGEVIGRNPEYEGRLYAEVTEEGLVFPEFEGLLMYQMWQEDHWAGFTTQGFCENKTHVQGGDNLDGIEEEGTIYVPRDTQDVFFYCNPLYKTEDGQYYALQGDSFHSSVGYGGMSMSVKDELTWTENGEEYTYSAKYTVHLEGADPAERVVLVQMSADHTELARDVYTPEEMPESVTPTEGAAYFIVEIYSGDKVIRALNQPGDDPVKVWCRTEKIYCLPWYTQINWPE